MPPHLYMTTCENETMPNAYLAKVAAACDLSRDEAHDLWDKAKKIAADRGYSEDDDAYYPYVTGVFKNSVGKDCLSRLHDDQSESGTRIGAVLASLPSPTNEDKGKNPLKRAMQAALPKPKAPSKPRTPGKPPGKPAAPELSDEEVKLSRDLGELYHEMLSRWQSVADPLHQQGEPLGAIEWSDDNPYADLPAQVRELLQASAVLHFDELEDLRNVAERALRQWQQTQPQLLDELASSLKTLPDKHLRVLKPVVKELVDRDFLPYAALSYLDPVNNTDPNYWAKAFPMLLAANAYQHQRKTVTGQNQDHHRLAKAVTDTLTEALLSSV